MRQHVPKITLLLSILWVFPAFAQRPDPNQDRLPQSLPNPEDAIPSERLPDITPPALPLEQPVLEEDIIISVNQIEVLGSTVFGAAELEPLIQPLEGRNVTLNELQGLTDTITRLYFDQGYLTSRAILPEQDITEGNILIQVIEGSIGEIEIEGNQQTQTRYLEQRLELGTDTPVQLGAIEDQLRLLQLNPLFDSVDATLLPGEELGESTLAVTVDEAKPLKAHLSIDNYSPPSVGDVRMGIGLSYQNLTGWGDQISLAYHRTTTGGSNLYDVSYRIPLNAMDGTLQLRTLISDSTQTLTNLDISGDSEFYEISFRQPLLRTPREEFALSLGFAYREGQTFLFGSPFPFGSGPDTNGISRTSVIKFGQDYIRRDPSGAWALQSQFSLGTSLLNATNNGSPTPDSQFLSWLGQAQRVQRLDKNNLLIVQASAQLASDSLLASEQFVIGGGQSLRGYRQNARSGDNGFRLSVEDRITLLRNSDTQQSTLQVIPFLDMGYVWNQNGNPNSQPSQRFLVGTGLGIVYQPLEGLSVRLDYGLPLVDIDDRGDNVQDDGFYFTVNYLY